MVLTSKAPFYTYLFSVKLFNPNMGTYYGYNVENKINLHLVTAFTIHLRDLIRKVLNSFSFIEIMLS